MGHCVRVFACLIAVFLAPAAGAITFTGPVIFGSTPVTALPGGAIDATDTANGFVLTGDVRVQPGGAFIYATRAFDVGPFPEQISVSATENWKIVLSGGVTPTSSPSFTISTLYSLIDNLAMRSASAFGSAYTQVGNGFHIVDDSHPNVLDAELPANRILTPGQYVLQLSVNASFDPGAEPPVFSQGAFMEFGGISSFAGFNIEVTGVPVPEPTSALLVATGLLGLAARGRSRS